jgi:hypothetical protein
VVGARAAAGTPCAGQTPVISCSDEVESAWGHTTEALAGFYRRGRGQGTQPWLGAARSARVRAPGVL